MDRRDVEATLAARADLGPEMQDALVDSFAERVERAIEARVGAELALRETRSVPVRPAAPRDGGRLALAIVSTVMGVPVTAIVLGNGLGLAALLIVWTGLVLVNVLYGRRR